MRNHPRPGAAGGGEISGIEYDESGVVIVDASDGDPTDATDAPDPDDAADDAAPSDTVARFDPPEEPVPDCSHGMQSDYVGHRVCKSRYGTWATPMRVAPMYLDWGIASRTLTVPVTATAVPLVPRAMGTGSHRLAASAVTTHVRFGMGILHGIYIGTELEVGTVSSDGVRLAGGEATPGASVFVGGYFVTGVRGAIGRVSLSTELAAGARSVQLQAVDRAGTTGPAPATGQGVVEARVRAELWISPWVSGGAVLGTSLVDRNETMVGGFLSFHTRAFGGDRAR